MIKLFTGHRSYAHNMYWVADRQKLQAASILTLYQKIFDVPCDFFVSFVRGGEKKKDLFSSMERF